MSLPPQFLDDLRARLPLSEVVGRRLRLTRAGREHKACCPFHKEKTPSFTVNDQKGFFHCFGCGAHGDIIGFVMQHDRLTFIEAVEHLAGQAGLQIPLPQATSEDRAHFEERKSLFSLTEAACEFFRSQLLTPAGRTALDYLRRRGLNDDMIGRFRLGYAPADGQALINALKAQDFTEAAMIEAGLVRQRDDGKATYSFFRNRVIFPVTDQRGRIVAFGGRILEGDGPKYINSPETSIFKKGQLLYGLDQARDAISRGETPIVVEGYLDVIALHQHGFRGTVAPLGTALNEEQIQVLWKMMPERDSEVSAPVICFDGDEAGARAAQRLVDRIMPIIEPNRSIRIALLPPGEDPDTLVRDDNGRTKFEHTLQRALPLVDYVWRGSTLNGLPKTPEARAGLRKHLTDFARKITDKTVRQLYLSELLNRFYDFCRPAVKFSASNDNRGRDALNAPPPVRTPKPDVVLISLLIHQPQILDDFISSIETIQVTNILTPIILSLTVKLVEEFGSLEGIQLQEYLVQLDPTLEVPVAKLKRCYRTHVNRGHRSYDYERDLFFDVLRSQQILRVNEDLRDAYKRYFTGNELEEKRINVLEAEYRRLLTEQTYLVERYNDKAFKGAMDSGAGAAVAA